MILRMGRNSLEYPSGERIFCVFLTQPDQTDLWLCQNDSKIKIWVKKGHSFCVKGEQNSPYRCLSSGENSGILSKINSVSGREKTQPRR